MTTRINEEATVSCPGCGQSAGLFDAAVAIDTYRCPSCDQVWRVVTQGFTHWDPQAERLRFPSRSVALD
jgi:uncharacterized C2H2 Zn-finger protein